MLDERISSKISIQGGCWVWTGSVTANGYGRVWDGRRSDWAHRVVYRLSKGEIPPGLQIDHLCRNMRCVNPVHLEAVTPAENAARSTNPEVTRARHKRKTHCKRGHPLFGDNVRLDRRGVRICRACQRLHGAAHADRTRQPNRVKRPIATPRGNFSSATDAARAWEIPVSTATWRAKTGHDGWSYIDLANTPARPVAHPGVGGVA